MENKEGYLEFVSSESYKHQLDVWYKTYNISLEKTQLFFDFASTLQQIIDSTFLGVDVIYTETDQKNHFTWCWDKLLDNFAKEKILFKERGTCYHYFWNFYLEAFYFPKMEDKTVRIDEYFYKLFSFTHRKTRSELDMLTEVYKMLEQNLKK
jgi:hypothetical protein